MIELYWLLGRTQKVLENKILKYEAYLRIWKELWGSASKFSVAIVQRVHLKILWTISDAPWYVGMLQTKCYIKIYVYQLLER